MRWKVPKWKAEMCLIVILMPAIKQNIMCLQFLHPFRSTKTLSLNSKWVLNEKAAESQMAPWEEIFSFLFFWLQSDKIQYSQIQNILKWPVRSGTFRSMSKGDISKQPRHIERHCTSPGDGVLPFAGRSLKNIFWKQMQTPVQ